MSVLQGFSDAADLAVVVPTWLAMVAGLAAGGWRRAAFAWLGVTTAVLSMALALKLVLLGSDALAWAGLRSPSGHTVSAAVIAGAVAGLVGGGNGRIAWKGAAWTAAAAGGLVGLTRVALGTHTTAEVVAMLPLGVLGAIALVRLQGLPPRGASRRPAVLLGALTALALYGAHVQAEPTIARAVGAATPWPDPARPSHVMALIGRTWFRPAGAD